MAIKRPETDAEKVACYERICGLTEAAFMICESAGSENRYEVRVRFQTLEQAQKLHWLLLGLKEVEGTKGE